MFSKKTVLAVGLIFLIMVNLIILAVASNRTVFFGSESFGIGWVAPFQKTIVSSIRFIKGIWTNYFFLVSVVKENHHLKDELAQAVEKQNRLTEMELSHARLRELLGFQKTMTNRVLAAELIGRDPSPWFKTIVIDKGNKDGVVKGAPVVVPQGIVGQVVHATGSYAKVLLMIDSNSAVDALVQRTRARGIVKGEPSGQCLFDYVLRKHEIRVGDVVITTGLDGIFPKGLRVGHISAVVKRNAGIFQEVMVTPFVDFETLEEVLVIVGYPIGEGTAEE